jgi:acetyl/propionyl-CoA carboxylase alpha subunit
MMFLFRIGEDTREGALTGSAQARHLLLREGDCSVSLTELGGGAGVVQVDGVSSAVYLAGTDDRRFVHINGEVFEIAVLDPLFVYAHKAVGGAGLLARAPMPGSVVALPVSVGAAVRAGDILVIIESMKLEVAIKAEHAGTVRQVHFEVGRTFEKNAVLVTLAGVDEG